MIDTSNIIDVGDVLVTRADGLAGTLIRIGGALRGQPNTVGHVAIAHHRDTKGDWVCIEGRPGGVGWAPAAKYLASGWTITNENQPKTPAQRQAIAKAAEALLQRPYDWTGIALDVATALGLNDPTRWEGRWDAAAVVCSSAAAWVYDQVGLLRPPGNLRTITPADWAQFIAEHPRG